jgi:hypothetical protein
MYQAFRRSEHDLLVCERCGICGEPVEYAAELASVGPLEHEIQSTYIARHGILAPHIPVIGYGRAIPNGGFRKHRTHVALWYEGVRPGIPDWVFPFAARGYHSFWTEFKRLKERKSPDQIDYIDWLRAQGHYVIVSRSADHAMQALCWYIGRLETEPISQDEPILTRRRKR